MARTFGQMDCSAWRDLDDWCTLSMDAQWLYMMLISQPDITMAGQLPIADRRWRQMNGDKDAARIEVAVIELIERRYVVVDEATDEILIRSFARTRTQWENSRRVRAMASAVAKIHSTFLREALEMDLSRVGRALDGSVISPTERPTEPSSERPVESPPEAPEIPSPMSDISAERSGTRSRAPAREKGEGRRETGEFLTGGDATAAEIDEVNPIQALVGAYIDACGTRPPTMIIARIGKSIRELLDDGQQGEAIHAGLMIVASKGLQPSALPGVVHELATKHVTRYSDAVWDGINAGDDPSILDAPAPALAGVSV